MKIALLHYSAQPVVGGVESVMGHHARLAADAGYDVCILAGRGAQVDQRIPFNLLPLLDSLHPEILAQKADLNAGFVPSRFDSLVEQIKIELEEHLTGVEVLLVHNVCSLNKNLPLTAALKKISAVPGSPRLILWHHDLAWTTPRYRAELHDGYPWDLLRTDWPGTIQVTISELRRQELAVLYGIPQESIRIIPNGIDVEKFLNLGGQARQLAKQLNLLSANPLFLLPVRITPRKNIELAIRTLHALKAFYPRAALVVTGPLGPHNPANKAYFSQLAALRTELGLSDSVHFLAEHASDYLPDEVIADFYRLADALLLPSREEGFGIPILEAGLVGLPIFCADIPPLRDLGKNFAAYFSPDADPQQIAGLIVQHFTGDAAYGLRQNVKSRYGWQQIYTSQIQPLLMK